MLTAERYLLLIDHFKSVEEAADQMEVTVEQLGELFHCTARNVKIIIHKLVDEGLIYWYPGRGRGNRSRLELRMNRDVFLMEQLKQLVHKGDYHVAFEFLHRYERNSSIRESFMEWLNSHFGYQNITSDMQGKDVFRLPIYRSLISLDPAELYYAFDSHMVRQLFDRLVQYDPSVSQIKPMLAHSWESNASATEWVFHLRKGVRFHHGSELTAEDAVFSLQRLKKAFTHRWMLTTVKEIRALDGKTVHITLHQPNRLLPHLLSAASASILPADILRQSEDRYWDLPKGTGPFRITHRSDSTIDLVVNEDYYQGRPYLDGVTLVLLPDNIPNASRLQWRRLIANDSRVPSQPGKDWDTIETSQHSCSLLSWNRNKSGPQLSLLFRKAVDMVIDRNGLIASIGNQGVPSYGFLTNEQDTPTHTHRFDPDSARRWLQEARYEGTPIRLVTTQSSHEEALWIQQQCALIDIPVDIHYEDRNSLMTQQTIRQADCTLVNHVFAEEDIAIIETYLQENSMIHQHMEPNLRRWTVSMISEVYATNNENKRISLLKQIEHRLSDEEQVLFLVHRTQYTHVHPSVRGLGINRLGWMDFKDIWLTTGNKLN